MRGAATASGFSPSLMEAAKVLRMGALSLSEWLRDEAAKNPCLRPGKLPPPLAEQPGLREVLRAQCESAYADSSVLQMTEALILSLDDDGFLPLDDDERISIIDNSGLSREKGAAVFDDALALLQSFNPAGVGGLDLADSLRLQLLRMPQSEGRDALLALLPDKLRWLLRRRYDKLPRRHLHKMLAVFEKLSPSPGRVEAAADHPAPVDVRFVRERGLWKAEAADGGLPSAADGGESDEWWRARRVVSLVSARRRKLLAAAQFAADRQSAFFSGGAGELAPLPLSEAAGHLGVSAAMMSHIVCDKRCLAGGDVFALELLFPRPVCGEKAAGAVCEMIREIVAQENPARPLSDGALRAALRERGADMARRTVAGYRRRAGVAPASLRKKPPQFAREHRANAS